MSRTSETARRLFDRFEPIHAVTYFSSEARAVLDELGYRGFWMGYFAARSAPLGPVSGELVAATFYNFAEAHVARALPAAWEFAPPAAALKGRQSAAVAALNRCGLTNDAPDVRRAATLLQTAARSAPSDGRPLFAANCALEWPDDPVAAMWHATTLLREHRGDGHVALLVGAGISGRESNVLHCAADRVPRDMIMRSRQYDEAEWEQCVARLAARGLLDATGGLTEAGAEFKRQLERDTDRLALAAFDSLDDDELETLFRALTPLTRKVLAGGDIPEATPMGLSRTDLNDDAAHVR